MATGATAARPLDPSRSVTRVFDGVVLATDRDCDRLAAARLAANVAAPGGKVAVLEGRNVDAVLDELVRRDATLVVTEIDERRRALGIAERSLATVLLHEAPCSVLVARPEADLDEWPRSIVVGLDGSIESAAAAAAAWSLGSRLDARVRALVATKGGHADLELVRRIAPAFEAHRDHPVPLLVAASKHAGLVVVGSRGLRGLRALGSVSERVGHHAESPVLVVRNEDHRKGAAR